MDKLCLLVDPVEHDKATEDSQYLFQQMKIPAKIHKSFFSFSCQKSICGR